jgi:cytochrome P450
MERFVELPVSVFDPGFTLNPFNYLEELYPRKEHLGFRSEGKYFLFRHDDCNAVLKSHACLREPIANPANEAVAARIAEEYPNRTWVMANNHSIGEEDLKTKALLIRLMGKLSESASFEIAEPTFEKLGIDSDNDNYVSEIATLPLKIMMDTLGMETTAEETEDLYDAGCTYLHSFDNNENEPLLAASDEACRFLRRFAEEYLPDVRPGTLVYDFMESCRSNGLTDDQVKGNIIGPLIVSASNTMGISSTFLLRNLVRYPAVCSRLRENPDILDDDNVLIEFLRRDNHVKALSRQVHEDVEIGDFTIPAGEAIYLFFPGANLDPEHWDDPLELDFTRNFEQRNQIIFGGAKHVCIGKVLGIAFLRHMAKGFIRYLPESARINDADMEMDGTWITERIIKKMPIDL